MKRINFFVILIAIFCGSSVWAQQRAGNGKLYPYDKDVYVKYSMQSGYEMISNYFLKLRHRYVEIQADEESGWDGYRVEEEDGKYFVFDLKGKRYQLAFKPESIENAEKDAAYFEKCEEVAKDYALHPDCYEDVTLKDPETKESTGCYIDKDGSEWILESENPGIHVLEKENVFILFEQLMFIHKKTTR